MKEWMESEDFNTGKQDPRLLGLAENTSVDLKKICKMMLLAIRTMHKRGIVHGDIKPGAFESKINLNTDFYPDKNVINKLFKLLA